MHQYFFLFVTSELHKFIYQDLIIYFDQIWINESRSL